MTPRQREFFARVVAEMERDATQVPGSRQLAQAVGAPPQAVEEILRLGSKAGELVQIAPDMYMSPARITRHSEELRDATGGEPFAPARAREVLGMTRRIANPLLDYLDDSDVTVREAGVRRFNA